MLKYLRIAVTALSLTACVLLIVLWVRSYWVRDTVWQTSENNVVVGLTSNAGMIYFEYFRLYPGPNAIGLQYSTGPPMQHRKAEVVRGYTLLRLPYWVVLIVMAGFAVIPWLNLTKRFSVRTLLIATTLIAVALGIIVAAR